MKIMLNNNFCLIKEDLYLFDMFNKCKNRPEQFQTLTKMKFC